MQLGIVRRLRAACAQLLAWHRQLAIMPHQEPVCTAEGLRRRWPLEPHVTYLCGMPLCGTVPAIGPTPCLPDPGLASLVVSGGGSGMGGRLPCVHASPPVGGVQVLYNVLETEGKRSAEAGWALHMAPAHSDCRYLSYIGTVSWWWCGASTLLSRAYRAVRPFGATAPAAVAEGPSGCVWPNSFHVPGAKAAFVAANPFVH